MLQLLKITHRALSRKILLNPGFENLIFVDQPIIIYTPADQLEKVKSLSPIQIRDSILKAVSKANSLGADEFSIAVDEAETGAARVVECVNGLCRFDGVDAN